MARLLRGEELAGLLSGLVHAPKQVGPLAVDLTLHALFRPSRAGSLDFGGGEYEPAVREALPAQRRRPEDRYGWWEVEGGGYLMEYNESLSLPAGSLSILCPHERLLEAGASHPTLVVAGGEGLPAVPLWVPSPGLSLKENARVSRLVAFVPV